MDNNCFILLDESCGEAALVDPGFGGSAILKELPEGARVNCVLLTHGHFDHVAELGRIVRSTGARVGIHADDAEMLKHAPQLAEAFGMHCDPAPAPDFFLNAGEEIEVGREGIGVRHTPGHSPGGIVLLIDGIAIVGDALFAGSIGRTDLPGADHHQLIASIRQQIMTLPDETVVWPGHGPQTTVGIERQNNPYLL